MAQPLWPHTPVDLRPSEGSGGWGLSCPDSPTKPARTPLRVREGYGRTSPPMDWAAASTHTLPADSEPLSVERYEGSFGSLPHAQRTACPGSPTPRSRHPAFPCSSPVPGRSAIGSPHKRPPSTGRYGAQGRVAHGGEVAPQYRSHQGLEVEPAHQNPFSPMGLQMGSRHASPALRASPCRSASPGMQRQGTPSKHHRILRMGSLGSGCGTPRSSQRKKNMLRDAARQLHNVSPLKHQQPQQAQTLCSTTPGLSELPRAMSADTDLLFSPPSMLNETLSSTLSPSHGGSFSLQRADTVAVMQPMLRDTTPAAPATPRTSHTPDDPRTPQETTPDSAFSAPGRRGAAEMPESPAKSCASPPSARIRRKESVAGGRRKPHKRMDEFNYCVVRDGEGGEHPEGAAPPVRYTWEKNEALLFEDQLCCLYKVQRKLDGMFYSLIVLKEAVTEENEVRILAAVHGLVVSQLFGSARYIDCWKEAKRKCGRRIHRLCILTELVFPVSLLSRHEVVQASRDCLLEIGGSLEEALAALHHNNIAHTDVSLESVVTSLREGAIDMKLGLFHRAVRFPTPPGGAVSQEQRLAQRRDYFLLGLTLLELVGIHPFANCPVDIGAVDEPRAGHNGFMYVVTGEGSSESPKGNDSDSKSARGGSGAGCPMETDADCDSAAAGESSDGDEAYDSPNWELRHSALLQAGVGSLRGSEAQWAHLISFCCQRLDEVAASKAHALPPPVWGYIRALLRGETECARRGLGCVQPCQRGAVAYMTTLTDELTTLHQHYNMDGSRKPGMEAPLPRPAAAVPAVNSENMVISKGLDHTQMMAALDDRAGWITGCASFDEDDEEGMCCDGLGGGGVRGGGGGGLAGRLLSDGEGSDEEVLHRGKVPGRTLFSESGYDSDEGFSLERNMTMPAMDFQAVM